MSIGTLAPENPRNRPGVGETATESGGFSRKYGAGAAWTPSSARTTLTPSPSPTRGEGSLTRRLGRMTAFSREANVRDPSPFWERDRPCPEPPEPVEGRRGEGRRGPTSPRIFILRGDGENAMNDSPENTAQAQPGRLHVPRDPHPRPLSHTGRGEPDPTPRENDRLFARGERSRPLALWERDRVRSVAVRPALAFSSSLVTAISRHERFSRRDGTFARFLPTTTT